MRLLERLESLVIIALILLLFVGIVLGTIELGDELVQAVIAPPFLLITPQTLFNFFGLFLIILVGLELLKLLKLRLRQKEIRPELVVEVALIAICNEVVTYDQHLTSGTFMFGTAALVLALSIGYYVFFTTRRQTELNHQAPSNGGP